MNQYAEILKTYLSENPPANTRCSVETALDTVLRKLPLTEQDMVNDMTCDLCFQYQREAFRDGILLGFRLFAELTQSTG